MYRLEIRCKRKKRKCTLKRRSMGIWERRNKTRTIGRGRACGN
jgi:hypothetical protein